MEQDEQQKPTEKGQKQKNIDAVEQHRIKGKETNPGETMGEEEYGTDYTDDNIVFAPQNNVKTPDEAFSSLKKFKTVEERIGKGNVFIRVREDTHKKMVFLVLGPLRFYPPYTNGF